ncbi:G:T/U mismatch-specific DNA glycosylase [Strigomonas culicis]|uniref:G:T/U mismatch-specific DNA glycosylase n=1 Tax=Strigomonas culicis TaxID=28005 RepID=S9WAB2_9TRYP|nr:G:T/U mismatch-specific DNA glycosylase [Strigomonas culicis]|eukprot:EPY32910.1 G:T/U mismatch-specific DNA glycosylase [Strigomonas culicis]
MSLLDTRKIRSHVAERAKKATRVVSAATADAATKKKTKKEEKTIVEEEHPIGPAVHAGTRVVLFGTFPPVRKQIRFYYPNPQNDMWNMLGHLFYHDREHFYVAGASKRTLNEAAILHFASTSPVGFADHAQRVRRVAGNSSDENIDVLQRVDVQRDILAAAPACEAFIATGTAALEGLLEMLSALGHFEDPAGHIVEVCRVGRGGRVRTVVPPLGEGYVWRPGAQSGMTHSLRIYRAPSTSRALPMPLEAKEGFYRTFFASHLHLA